MAARVDMSRLEIAITTHHDLETGTPARPLVWLKAFKDAEVTVPPPMGGARTAKVTVSVYSEAARLFNSGRNDLKYRLFVRFEGQPAIWAPARTSWAGQAGTCVISCVDADRLQNHFLRDGDTAIDPANAYSGSIPVDYRGLRLLRDAANNTTEQDDRFVAPLGIRDGDNDAPTSTQRVKLIRSNQVFSSMTQLTAGLGAPEWELAPLDVDDPDAYPDYMLLNTYEQMGGDYSNAIAAPGYAQIFHFNYGLRNLDDFRADPGQFITHAHVLGDGGQPRVTRYHALSSRERGIYVHWAATQLKIDAGDSAAVAALGQIADAFIKAYGLPLQAYTLALKPDALQRWVPLYDMTVGSIITAGTKRGYFTAEIPARIMGMTIKQTSRLRDTTADLKVVPSLVDDGDIDTGEE